MQMCVGGRNVSGERPNATSFLGSLGAPLRGAATAIRFPSIFTFRSKSSADKGYSTGVKGLMQCGRVMTAADGCEEERERESWVKKRSRSWSRSRSSRRSRLIHCKYTNRNVLPG